MHLHYDDQTNKPLSFITTRHHVIKVQHFSANCLHKMNENVKTWYKMKRMTVRKCTTQGQIRESWQTNFIKCENFMSWLRCLKSRLMMESKINSFPFQSCNNDTRGHKIQDIFIFWNGFNVHVYDILLQKIQLHGELNRSTKITGLNLWMCEQYLFLKTLGSSPHPLQTKEGGVV